MRKLQRPRYVMVPLPEFMQKAGRDAFVNNHQMPPFEKVGFLLLGQPLPLHAPFFRLGSLPTGATHV
jgi:hypothetical protein